MSSDFKQNTNPKTVPRLHPLKHHQSVRVEETVVRASAYGEFERNAYEQHLKRLAMLGLCHCSASLQSGRSYQEDRTSTYEHPIPSVAPVIRIILSRTLRDSTQRPMTSSLSP